MIDGGHFPAVAFQHLAELLLVAVAAAPGQTLVFQRVGGQVVGLTLLHYLDAVFHGAQKTVGLAENHSGFGVDQAVAM